MKIGILDYSTNNVYSVYNAFYNLGYNPKIIRVPSEIKTSEILIVPGIGNAFYSISILKSSGCLDEIKEFINLGKPILGICLGLQIFCKKLFEGGESYGIGLIDANVIKIKKNNFFNIGWGEVLLRPNKLLKNQDNLKKNYYFCHSYKLEFNTEKKKEFCKGIFKENDIPSIIIKDNFVGLQFHPEKSQNDGLSLIKTFLEKI
jgi:glutamine amidotransferase